MLLAVDIGNTYITIGAFSGEELLFVTEVESSRRISADRYAVIISGVVGLYTDSTAEVSGAVICSVVPELSEIIKTALMRLYDVKPILVGPGVKTGLHIDIENPAQLGADIAACAVGAINSVPLPCVVCDFGTATTFSVIDSSAKLTGVVICPGISTSLAALTDKTALLPHISLDRPKSIVGKNTISSMQSGFVYGFASMADGVIDRIEEELGMSANICVTGMFAEKIADNCKKEMTVNKHLLLEGLRLIYLKNHG